ncbi:hypothetical protein [Salinibius halmophilus]|uniref:hypothetical protein n=1 Tax=Salinibius halmophilus TaxID=1853216 RepID=UPI000E6666EA|nr:hypothetical protein [Salinibius halmophilus]
MGLIITGLAFAVVVGAWLWLRPSPRERRINKLHTDAFANGLKLRYESLPDMSNEGRVREAKKPFTFFNREFKEKQAWPSYTLLRTQGESSKYLPVGWYLQQGEKLDRDVIEQHLFAKLAQLPEEVVAVTQWPLGIGIAIDERRELEIEQIKQWLDIIQWN